MTGEADAPILRVECLSVEFATDVGVMRAVDGIGLDVREGEIVGLVGESGSGKTVTARSIMRLIPEPPGRICGGRVLFEGGDLLALDERSMRQVRGRSIAMVFQDPSGALNPVLTVGYQVAAAVRHHHGVSRAEGRARARRLLKKVRLPDVAARFGAYPHELSGGMQQRVTIAVALAGGPRLLIADEPTASLDVTVQARILQLLRDLRNDFGMSILLITHDIGVVNELCDRVVVLYGGRVAEEGPRAAVLGHPRHPYTQALMKPAPSGFRLTERAAGTEAPSATGDRRGCPFLPRCASAMPVCGERDPEPARVSMHHRVWCHAIEGAG